MSSPPIIWGNRISGRAHRHQAGYVLLGDGVIREVRTSRCSESCVPKTHVKAVFLGHTLAWREPARFGKIRLEIKPNSSQSTKLQS